MSATLLPAAGATHTARSWPLVLALRGGPAPHPAKPAVRGNWLGRAVSSRAPAQRRTHRLLDLLLCTHLHQCCARHCCQARFWRRCLPLQCAGCHASSLTSWTSMGPSHSSSSARCCSMAASGAHTTCGNHFMHLEDGGAPSEVGAATAAEVLPVGGLVHGSQYQAASWGSPLLIAPCYITTPARWRASPAGGTRCWMRQRRRQRSRKKARRVTAEMAARLPPPMSCSTSSARW